MPAMGQMEAGGYSRNIRRRSYEDRLKLNLLSLNGLATAVLGATLLGSGCASTVSDLTEGEGLVLLGAALAESGDPTSEKLAPYISILGQMRYQKEIIREGRTDINIVIPENVVRHETGYLPSRGYVWKNPEEPGNLEVKTYIGSAFSVKWIDYDDSGNYDSGEMVEIKRRFNQNENVAVALLYVSEIPFNQEGRFYDPQGRLRIEERLDFRNKNYSRKIYSYPGDPGYQERDRILETGNLWSMEEWNRLVSEGEVPPYFPMPLVFTKEIVRGLLEIWGEGEYSVVFRINGRVMDIVTFELIYH